MMQLCFDDLLVLLGAIDHFDEQFSPMFLLSLR